MALCRFAYLTCQHGELWKTRSPWARGDRLCFWGMNTHILLSGSRVPCPGSGLSCPHSLHPGVEHEGCHPVKVWCVVAVGAARSGGCWWVKAAVGGTLICIAQPLWNVWVPMAILECSLPVGSTNPAQPVDTVGAPLSGINPSGFVVQKRWDLNLQVSLDNCQELWTAREDWLSVSGPVTGLFAHRRWNSFNRWICHFPSSGGYGSCFRGEGDVNSWSWDRAEMARNLSELSSVSVTQL